ncbi:predicted protein [Naegleria gruberi]|uniref:Predicted protein n=1 Tax=Naegleria gruberi TaxID=5762 RepID=D2W2H5_NAEGR|nr:uncharacterized protein NAEGRDRAFT_75590 [Naegleria gruberi]EFC36713.1 predicted protein [Naegleria gruberi]|eukprot:XP_002669457.1 predicted protein [Naegleria gruberi strain NEG-M]
MYLRNLKYPRSNVRQFDDEFIVEASWFNVSYFRHGSVELRRNREVVLKLCKHNGMVIQYVNAKLRFDREIILETLKNCPSAIEFIPNELKFERDLINQVFIHHYSDEINLEDLSDDIVWLRTYLKLFGINNIPRTWSRKYSNNKELMMEYIKENGDYLKFVSMELKNDKELVLQAVKNSGLAIYYASEELKRDREIVLEAVKQDGTAYNYVAPHFSSDKEIISLALCRDSNFFNLASESLKNDYEFVMDIVSTRGMILKFLPETLMNNRTINLAAILNNGRVIEFSPFKHDPEILNQVVKVVPYYYLRFVDLSMFSDETLIEAVRFSEDPFLITKRANYLDLLQRSIEYNVRLASSFPYEHLTEQLVLKFIRMDGSVIEYHNIKRFIHSDKSKYFIEAVKSNGFFTEFDQELYRLRLSEEYHGAIMH